MGGRRLAIAILLVGVSVAVGAGPAAANTSTQLDPGASRILIISTPGVGWSSINPIDTPNLWRLFRGAAIGNLTARTVGRPDLASGYLTLGAGNRAAASRTTLDGAGMEPSEPFGAVTASEAFALDTGRTEDAGRAAARHRADPHGQRVGEDRRRHRPPG